MVQFAAALLAFLVTHSIPALPGVRGRLLVLMGRRAYITAYSIVSLLLLAWLIEATLALDYVPLWDSAPWQAWATVILTPCGLFLLLAGLISPNPLSISPRQRGTPGAIIGITRHPVLIGLMAWAGSHLVPNGELRTVMLFGVLLAFAAIGIPLTERRAKKRLGSDWAPLAERTSILPFAALVRRKAAFRVDGAMIASLVITALVTLWLLTGGHALLFGADPLALALA